MLLFGLTVPGGTDNMEEERGACAHAATVFQHTWCILYSIIFSVLLKTLREEKQSFEKDIFCELASSDKRKEASL